MQSEMGRNRNQFFRGNLELTMYTRRFSKNNSNWAGIASYMPKPTKDYCRNKGCFRQVSEKVARFSKEKLGIVLCWDCQRIDPEERSIENE